RVWMRDLGALRGLEAASVAVDPEGAVLHAVHHGGVTKLDAGGDVAWHVDFGAVVATDARGDVYVASPPNGAGGVSLAKLRPDGSTIWTRDVGGPADADVRSL